MFRYLFFDPSQNKFRHFIDILQSDYKLIWFLLLFPCKNLKISQPHVIELGKKDNRGILS